MFQVPKTWSDVCKQNINSSNNTQQRVDTSTGRYVFKPIVNEFELQKEIALMLPIDYESRNMDRETYINEVIKERLHTGHYQETMDEDLYFKVCVPYTKRFITKDKRIEYIHDFRKAFFKNFFQYLDYQSWKAGVQPREDFFTSERSYNKALDNWKRKASRKVNIVKGLGWNSYVRDYPEVQEFIDKQEREYREKQQEKFRRMEEIDNKRREYNQRMENNKDLEVY